MIDLKHYQAAIACLPEGVREAEVNAETHNITDVTVSGESVRVESARQTALYLRASGERTGYVYTQNLSEDAQAAIRTAYANSLESEAGCADVMNRRAEVCCYGDEAAELNAHSLAETARELGAALREKIGEMGMRVETQVRLKAETYGQHTVNSHGLDAGFAAPLYLAEFHASDEAGDGFGVDQVAGGLNCFDLDGVAKYLYDHIRWQKDASGRFVSGDYPVILSEEAAYNLFATAWQEFSALKYLDGASQLAGKLGEKIAPDCLNITDSAEAGFPMYCDSEGTAGRDAVIVEKGVFKGLLHNCKSAAAMGLENTGNAARRPLLSGNIPTDMLVTPKNFCIQPGDSSLEEMMEHMGSGILITQYLDLFHSLDISSGNFSAPCYGVRIENGREAGNLTALTVTGNFLTLLQGIQEVGRERLVRPMCALENYGIGACALRVDSLNVSGEA